jgi:hypothetical protein
MTTDLIKYEIWCNNENIYVETYGYLDTPPTYCPHDDTHVVDTSNINEIARISRNILTITDDASDVQGLWRAHPVTFTASDINGATTTHDISWKYNIRGLSATIYPSADNVGDIFSSVTAPDTDLSVIIPTSSLITSDVAIGDKIINVNPLLFKVLMIGYKIKLYNSSLVEEELGECIGINKTNNTITVENVATNNFTTADDTKILFTIPRVLPMLIPGVYPMVLGETKLGASLLPAGVKLRFYYTNNGTIPKTLTVVLQILN